MGKIIFLFPSLKITTDTLEDLELTENFLTGKQVDKLGYNAEELSKAYKRISKEYKII